jgi:8-oxo-dGTP pyrophosphatase MutT (NUDIX family)
MTDLLDSSGPNPWRTESSKIVFDNGRMRLLEDAVLQPDGEPGSYAYIEVPWPIVGIVPVTDDNCVYLVRQWRYPWRRNSWEIPAGHGEGNEQPLEAAQRELAEEVGIHASSWEPLGRGFGSAAINASYHLFLARGLEAVPDRVEREGSEHDMIARPVPLLDAVEAAMDGRIVHAFTVVGLLRAARKLGV